MRSALTPRLAAALGVALVLTLPALPVAAQDAHLARNLAATCANCHGTTGTALGDMKPLAGMPSEKLLALVADFKSGARPATVMHQISKGFTDEQMKLIAGYFAAQQPRR